MSYQPLPPENDLPSAHNRAVACREYTFDQLAEIYNNGRVDYIVPMPMNGKRMLEYVRSYDVSLDGSIVALDAESHEPNGIGMLGLRGHRSWITRLGVTPSFRRRYSGEFIMRRMIEYAQEHGATLSQLEVIKGNEPAKRLFEKLGFQTTRELLIVRRPPARLSPEVMAVDTDYRLLEDEAQLIQLLTLRADNASWVEETASLLNSSGLKAIEMTLSDGEYGWLVFQRSPFQLSHFVFSPNISTAMTHALLAQLHTLYPLQDTKVENIEIESPHWSVLQQFGYLEVFRRIEMILDL